MSSERSGSGRRRVVVVGTWGDIGVRGRRLQRANRGRYTDTVPAASPLVHSLTSHEHQSAHAHPASTRGKPLLALVFPCSPVRRTHPNPPKPRSSEHRHARTPTRPS
eukprot:scaffold15122_cov140-Isochrysis_galbana.AAC.1